ncbi:MAG: T9SS type A sorting domain-containing protein [Saprospiraceae bacterium]|nr:T9SS type A sorting domain-containing protein [Saprospiraceae bacterium]
MNKNLLAFLVFGCFFSSVAFTQSSFLDSTFANNGNALISLNINGNYCQLNHAALQSDGKIIAVGETAIVGVGSRAVAVRLLANGMPDITFGDNGEWVSADAFFLFANEVLVQPDDKILITGWGAGIGKVARLNPDGTYDSSFGTNGTASFNIWGGGANIMIDMELQSDGKLLVSGYKAPESAVVRLNTNGTLDNTFGTAGKVIVKPSLFGTGANYVYGLKIGLTSDQSVVVSGVYSHPTKPAPGFVIKYNVNGQIDPSFGENGIAEFYRLEQQISDLFVLPNDEILVLCDLRDPVDNYPRVSLVKWLPNGKIDSSFANQGYGHLTVGQNGAYNHNGYLQPDGKVVVLGLWAFPTSPDSKPSMSRFNADGSMDLSFGINGLVTTAGLENTGFNNGLVQPDGKIVAVTSYGENDAVYGNIRRYKPFMTLGAFEAASRISATFLYPNPVYDQTLNISYELQEASNVKIDLFNVKGELVTTLLNAPRKSGKNEEVINLPDLLVTGAYFLQIQSERGRATVKFLQAGQ